MTNESLILTPAQRNDAALLAIAHICDIRRADSNAILSHNGTHAAGDSDAAFVSIVSQILALTK